MPTEIPAVQQDIAIDLHSGRGQLKYIVRTMPSRDQVVSIVRHRATINKVVSIPVNPKMTVVAGMPIHSISAPPVSSPIGIP